MDNENSKLVEKTKSDETYNTPARVPLETPFTVREKRLAYRKYLKNKFRDLRKISRKALKGLDPISLPSDEEIEAEPLQFGQRVVLRSQVTVSVEGFQELHALYKKDSDDATSILKATKRPNHGLYAFDRSALRAEFQEQQRLTTQMSSLFPDDEDLDRRAQEICEQAVDVHGILSDVEIDLLGEYNDVDYEVIDEWCKAKNSRLKACRAANNCRRHLLASARNKNFEKLPKFHSSTDLKAKPQHKPMFHVQNPMGPQRQN